jgi:hypothetical protein
MTQVDSKLTKQSQETGKARTQKCRALRFHAEEIEKAQSSLPSEKEIAELSNLTSAITSIWQRKIIFALAKGRLCVCDIAYVIGLSIPATAHQLKHLHEQKLIGYENDGSMAWCFLTNQGTVDFVASV